MRAFAYAGIFRPQAAFNRFRGIFGVMVEAALLLIVAIATPLVPVAWYRCDHLPGL